MGQRIIQGIQELLPELNGKKVLMVRGKSYEYLPIKTVMDSIECIVFSEFTPNPLYEQVCKGVSLFNQNECEVILAIGGGSAIDVAKCIKLFCYMNPNQNYLEQEKKDTKIPLIAIPTTAGTGSESTKHAVIYYAGKKQSISHFSIIPDVAVLEPSSLMTLPVYQKKCTMLDALCQAIESWWSVNSTEESIEYSKRAISLIRSYAGVYIEENTELAAKRILEASNYAGRAINITATTAAHAMSYKITSLYKFPHGHAVAICMKEVWQYIRKHPERCIDKRGREFFNRTMDAIEKQIPYEWFLELLEKLQIEGPVSENREEELNMLIASVNPERLKNNPVLLETIVLRELYERIIA